MDLEIFFILLFSVFDMRLLGADATEREGIYWTLTGEDHPAIALFSSPQKAAAATTSHIGIRVEEEDRTRYGTDCIEPGEDKEWEDKYGLTKTRQGIML